MNLIKLYRVGNFFYRHKIPLLPKLIRFLIFVIYNSDVPSSVKIGKNSLFGHGGIGVVIHPRAVIGENCIIGQGITIGGKSRHVEVPKIGDNVYIAAGARILGPITIGSYVVVAANSVVTKNVQDRTVVAGVPAKVIQENINYEEFV